MHVVVRLILQVSPLKHDHGMNVNRLSHAMAMEFGKGVSDHDIVKRLTHYIMHEV